MHFKIFTYYDFWCLILSVQPFKGLHGFGSALLKLVLGIPGKSLKFMGYKWFTHISVFHWIPFEPNCDRQISVQFVVGVLFPSTLVGIQTKCLKVWACRFKATWKLCLIILIAHLLIPCLPRKYSKRDFVASKGVGEKIHCSAYCEICREKATSCHCMSDMWK